MSDKSKIEWTEATWNPIRFRNHATGGVGHFCEKVSPGCAHCYAATMQKRFKNHIRYNAADRDKGELFLDERVLTQPLRWKRPRMIFPCSMTDLFGPFVEQEWIERIVAVMSACGQHTFQVLTKRPERMRAFFAETTLSECQATYCARMTINEERTPVRGLDRIRDTSAINGTRGAKVGEGNYWPLPNAWWGVTVESQEYVERIEQLLATPAAVRFISAEPLLGPLDLDCTPWPNGWERPIDDISDGIDPLRFPRASLDWVIVGGESGPGARPMHPQWVRDLRDQCTSAGVPFFFKQWGEWHPAVFENGEGDICYPDNEAEHQFREHAFGDGTHMLRFGKQAAGRLLDGREWSEFPDVTTSITS